MEGDMQELGNLELIDALCRSMVDAGTFNHGRVFDPGHSMHMCETQRLRAAVLARLDRRIPPARQGDTVMLTAESSAVDAISHVSQTPTRPQLVPRRCYTVHYVHYLGDSMWGCVLQEMGDQLFPAEKLTVVHHSG